MAALVSLLAFALRLSPLVRTRSSAELERDPAEVEVAGSNPAGFTNLIFNQTTVCCGVANGRQLGSEPRKVQVRLLPPQPIISHVPA